MERIWLKQYPQGVPADIDVDQYTSIVQIFEESFKKFANRPAYTCMDKTMTYAEVDTASRAVGAWLQSRGLQPGDRVAVMMPNVLQYPAVIAGILRAGYVVVNVNPLYTPRELEHQLTDSGAKAVFVLEMVATTLEQVMARVKIPNVVVATLGDMLGFPKGTIVNTVVRKVKKLVPAFNLPGSVAFKSVLSAGRGMTLKPVTLKPGDVAFLQYTGGTTGVSKGATLLHRNVVANVLQNEAWLQPALKVGKPIEQLNIVTALPLYHIFALTVCCLLAARVGGHSILITNPRDIPGFVKDLAKRPFHVFPAVNTLYNGLLNNADFRKLDFSNLKVCNGGGMAVQKAVAEEWVKLTGCPIVEGYGLSETSPTLTSNPVTIKDFTGSIGYPVSNTLISIRDDDEKEVAQGQSGEICAKGPQIMPGYWNRPDETAKVMTKDGFFKTGDIGVMDANGQFKIVDRKKDMILVSGFNVYPNEVEDVIVSHPGVLECAAVGVPDKNSGEAVMVFVVKKDPNLDEKALRDYCETQLTGYKRPKHIKFRTDLPKTNVGKILRRALRDEVTKEAVKAA